MNCSELRQEYENLFRIEKFTDPDKYLWEMSNSRYIMWLEDRIKYNLPPNKVYCLYYRDIFNIVDAMVYGHLFDYDISPNLSLNLTPYCLPSIYSTPTFGLSMRFNIK